MSGQFKEYTANVIAKSMMSQVDSVVFRKTSLESIVDHMSYELLVVPYYECYIYANKG